MFALQNSTFYQNCKFVGKRNKIAMQNSMKRIRYITEYFRIQRKTKWFLLAVLNCDFSCIETIVV